MPHARIVRARRDDRLREVGRRWQTLIERRAETVRRLHAGGPRAADSPARVALYTDREQAKQLAFARAGVTASYFQERIIGPTLDLDDYPPNDAARTAGMPVGRIVDLDDRGGALDGIATGFVVAPGLIMTNHHVFAAADECDGCGIQFGFEMQDGQTIVGPVFAFDAGRFFFTSDPLD